MLSGDSNVLNTDNVNSIKTTPTNKEGSTLSLPQSLPTMSSVVSMATETVDLPSPNYSLDESLISGASDVFDKEQEQALYQQLKVSHVTLYDNHVITCYRKELRNFLIKTSLISHAHTDQLQYPSPQQWTHHYYPYLKYSNYIMLLLPW